MGTFSERIPPVRSVAAVRPGSPSATRPSAVDPVPPSAGQPLDARARGIFEPRFGHDFSRVRIHADERASHAAQTLGARAYTVGRDVVFRAGELSPGTERGQRLLAHELTHVVQQGNGIRLKGSVGGVDDAYERHADAVADAVVAGKPARPLLVGVPSSAGAGAVSGPVVQRQSDSSAPVGGWTPWKPSQQDLDAFRRIMEKWAPMDAAKRPVAQKLSNAYVNRPGQLRLAPPTKAEVEAALYWGKKPVDPSRVASEAEVFNAIYIALDLKKSGKGGSPSEWELKDPAERPKSDDEKGKAIVDFAVEQGKGYPVDKLKEGTVEMTAKWLTERSLVLAASFLTGAFAVYSTVSLVLDVYDLLASLNEPAELSDWEEKNAGIVASVREWLEGRQAARDLENSLKQPYRPKPYLAVPSSTRIGP